MNATVLKLTLAFSLAFNAAFIGVAVFRTAPPEPLIAENAPATDTSMLAGIDLSAVQQAELTAGKQQTEARIADILEDSRQQRDALIELLKADAPDKNAIHEVQKKLGENQRKIREISVEHLMLVTSKLEPKQRQRFLMAMRHSPVKHYGGRQPSRSYMNQAIHAARVRKLLGGENVILAPRDIPGGMEVSIQSFDAETAERIKAMVPDYFRAVAKQKQQKQQKPSCDPKKESSQ
jgi:Spy/CpxP family protein refolding chaperone